MSSIIGFDSKETHREINSQDQIFPLGASIEIYDYEKFKNEYDKAMKTIWDSINEKRKRKVYSFQYFAKKFGMEDAQELLIPFLKNIHPHIINADIYFTNIPEKKIPEVYMYNMDERKETKKINEFLTTLVQPYSYICAWKQCFTNEKQADQILWLDNFQGKSTVAWNVLWGKKPSIYYKGDYCNALISTADILAGVVDNSLIDQPFSKKSINEILSGKLKLRGKTNIIGSQDLRWIVPVSRKMINTTRFLKHPIYYLITQKRPKELEYKESIHQFEYSPIFDEIANIAYNNNGAIKFYDKTQDYMHIRAEDIVIYFEETGQEIAKSLEKQKYIEKSYYYGYEKIK